MVTSKESLVYDLKLSTVVPGRVTQNKFHQLTGMDLAMKLHYLKGLYFFKNDETEKLTTTSVILPSIEEFKKPMFEWLVSYFITCGRVRTAAETGGRPVIKLNDAGIRIVEARSSKSVEEWLAMDDFFSLQDHLVYGLHDDLVSYTPLIFIQLTRFKCGGISVGLSWAHVLGDVLSASSFMNMLGHYLHGNFHRAQILTSSDPPKPKNPPIASIGVPRSLKLVDPVGDHWVTTTNRKMGTHAFHVTFTQLTQLHSKVQMDGQKILMDQCFELISAIMWKSIAKIRKELEPKLGTICRPKCINRDQAMPYNGQVVGIVEVNSSLSKIGVVELVSMIAKNVVNESDEIEEMVEQENGTIDCVVYGATLTFVNMEEVDMYDFKPKGERPFYASYNIDGVGEGGAILVNPGFKNGSKLVVVNLPDDELLGLRNELRDEWLIV